MALNDHDITLGGARSVDQYPGLANPTSASLNQDPMAANFADDPTNPDLGAGANSATFHGDEDAARGFKQTAGVVEGRPGMIESSGIAPLDASDNGSYDTPKPQASATGTGVGATASAYTESAKGYASTAAETATSALQAGKEAVFGKSE